MLKGGGVVDPMSVSAAVGYAAKVGSPKVASWVGEAVRRRGWARRAARKAFRKVERPRPARATAKWIKRSDILTGVLFSPDKPGSSAVASLDDHLCSTFKRWQRLERAERERRLDTVLGAVYDMVLTEHDARWTTRIASERILESTRRTRSEIAALRQETQTAREAGSENDVVERLALVPAHHRDAALRRWRDAKEDTWRVLSAVTSTETTPQAVVSQWQSALPEWLSACAVPARLVAADLAWAYGAPQLAARLYLSAARDRAPRAQHWAGRAILILVDTDHDAAMAAAGEFADLPADLLFQAVAAVVRQDWPRLRETLAGWLPDDPLERTLRFMLFQREALMGCGRDVIDRAVLDEVIAAGTKELAAGHLPGVAMIVARLLVLRAQRGEADHPYKDLRVAEELAVRVRDDRRAVRAPSAEAVAVACEAALAAGDPARVVGLGDATKGHASEQEAQEPAVREKVVLARALRGEDVGPIRPADATSPFAAARLRAAVAERRGTDPVPALQEALTAATDDYERITALAGLARAAAAELPGTSSSPAAPSVPAGLVRVG